MNRRRFLQLVTGAGVSTATMVEAGFVADFFNWLRRRPVHSIPKPFKPKPDPYRLHEYTYYWVNARTGKRISPDIVTHDCLPATRLEEFAKIYWDRNLTIKISHPRELVY